MCASRAEWASHNPAAAAGWYPDGMYSGDMYAAGTSEGGAKQGGPGPSWEGPPSWGGPPSWEGRGAAAGRDDDIPDAGQGAAAVGTYPYRGDDLDVSQPVANETVSK